MGSCKDIFIESGTPERTNADGGSCSLICDCDRAMSVGYVNKSEALSGLALNAPSVTTQIKVRLHPRLILASAHRLATESHAHVDQIRS
jgi:hypothetical protein